MRSDVIPGSRLQAHGLREINTGHHLSLFSRLGPVVGPIPPQPRLPNASLPPALPPPSPAPAGATSFAAFSFSQGDAAGFNQRDNYVYLNATSAFVPGRRIAELWPFSVMEGTFDAELHGNFDIVLGPVARISQLGVAPARVVRHALHLVPSPIKC